MTPNEESERRRKYHEWEKKALVDEIISLQKLDNDIQVKLQHRINDLETENKDIEKSLKDRKTECDMHRVYLNLIRHLLVQIHE